MEKKTLVFDKDPSQPSLFPRTATVEFHLSEDSHPANVEQKDVKLARGVASYFEKHPEALFRQLEGGKNLFDRIVMVID